MQLNILTVPGDGIGTEVTREAVKVLEKVATKYGHGLKLSEALLGGMYVHYMQDGTNKRERGFWGTFVHAGSRMGVEVRRGLRVEVEFAGRSWMFNQIGRAHV